MSSMEMYRLEAAEYFKNGMYERAAGAYTVVIDASTQHDTDLHKLYSNRCACYLKTNDLSSALSDALRCVELAPNWAKGHNRLAGCYFRLNRLADAVHSYSRAAELDPKNEEYKKSLRQAQATMSSSSNSNNNNNTNFNFGGDFQGPLQAIKRKLQEIFAWAAAQWAALAPEMRYTVIAVAAGALIYFLFFRTPSYGYDDNPYRGGGGGGGYYYSHGGGLSWTMWGAILLAAYQLPPMFPNQLGDYARPFFGMSLFHFMWILNMLTQNRGFGGFYGGGGLGGWGGRRRRW